MQVLDRKEYTLHGYRVLVDQILDEDPDLSYLEQECFGDYGQEQLASYGNDWHMIGIAVTAWKDGQEAETSLWGIESFSSASYLREVELELFNECRNQVGDTLARRAGYAATGTLQLA